MNGGVLHAVECLTASELKDAECGYRFYGFDAVAFLFARARQLVETDSDLELHESQLDQEYTDIIPGDGSIVERFERHLASNPSDYARLRATDMT
jgi:hypothetical protein